MRDRSGGGRKVESRSKARREGREEGKNGGRKEGRGELETKTNSL